MVILQLFTRVQTNNVLISWQKLPFKEQGFRFHKKHLIIFFVLSYHKLNRSRPMFKEAKPEIFKQTTVWQMKRRISNLKTRSMLCIISISIYSVQNVALPIARIQNPNQRTLQFQNRIMEMKKKERWDPGLQVYPI